LLVVAGIVLIFWKPETTTLSYRLAARGADSLQADDTE